jgi:hypothetical protein
LDSIEGRRLLLRALQGLRPTRNNDWVSRIQNVKLIATLHMVDEVVKARELLAIGSNLGVEPARLEQLEALLSEPLSMSLDALRRLIKMGKRTEALISAHMLVASYPSSQAAQAYLDEVLAMPT